MHQQTSTVTGFSDMSKYRKNHTKPVLYQAFGRNESISLYQYPAYQHILQGKGHSNKNSGKYSGGP